MELKRTPFQGVSNIIRFNWHLYLIALGFVLVLYFLSSYFKQPLLFYLSIVILLSSCISLLTSFYVYDISSLYQLKWIEVNDTENIIINIHAGFDETSELLQKKFPESELTILDFYDPIKHTEISIKRARKAYPIIPQTKQITTTELPFTSNSVDKIFIIFAAHEIRNKIERIAFFQELCRIIKTSGQIVVTEHLRDIPNFFSYNIGCFHFQTKKTWYTTFEKAQLNIQEEIKITPFISTFVLYKNGNSL